MKERPILFSAPMVRSILAGTKTQTRRALKPQPIYDGRFAGGWKVVGKNGHEAATCSPLIAELCPYGQPGDRLWVRETFCHQWNDMTGYHDDKFWYRASTPDVEHVDGDAKSPWKPSIHMPRAASRITLEITGVRVERLQGISEADAEAEGCAKNHIGYYWGGPHAVSGRKQMATAQSAYRDVWESINGAGSWDVNPWVWIVEFKRVEGSAT